MWSNFYCVLFHLSNKKTKKKTIARARLHRFTGNFNHFIIVLHRQTSAINCHCHIRFHNIF